MKTNFKKAISLILCLAMMTVICGSAFALDSYDVTKNSSDLKSPAVCTLIDDVIYITVSEYDVYVYNLKKEEAVLSRAGFSAEEIRSARTYEAESKVSDLAKLSQNALSVRGYSQAQISALKAYDGRPLEDAPELRRALPYMYATLTKGVYTTQAMSMSLNWEWSAAPVIYNYEDVIPIRFRAYNQSSLEMGVRYNASYTNASVVYRNLLSNALVSVHATPLHSDDVFQHIETSFSRPNSSLMAYAASGYFNCYVNIPTGATANIGYSTFIFAYAFKTTTVNFSISYPYGFSIEFGTGVDVALYVQATLATTGALTIDRQI